ncbi:MAG: ABC transporter ATP-binding protein [Anaerolineaceae bacterium]|jgi:lipopolysaccharide transport system ATP-binding protein
MNFANRLRNGTGQGKYTTFWALQDVSFEANEGDIIGIIGRNGAGKSTLLKILSRVTQPTTGRVTIYGRVGSLLEVGTGFHSELTGRENIFISGSIIGMSRAEIKKKFDEIVAFSGVEQFLDTPVKRFSSGMEVRLAFSVAAHLHPQVLLVDEVLSVGDAAFQQKSIAKIKEVSLNGGTILFISHNMTTVASLCNQAMVLEHGNVAFPLGRVSDAVEYYLSSVVSESKYELEESRQGLPAGPIKITGFTIRGEHGAVVDTLTSGSPTSFVIEYETSYPTPVTDVNFSILLKTLNGDVISNLSTRTTAGSLKLKSRTGSVTCKITKFPIAPGNISISLQIERQGEVLDMANDVFTGSVDSGGHFQKQKAADSLGWVLVDQDWSSS